MIRRWSVAFGLWLSRVGLWIADKSGWQPDMSLSEALNDDAVKVVKMTEAAHNDVSGDYKRRDAIRVLMNRHPKVRERDLALAVEIAVQRAL